MRLSLGRDTNGNKTLVVGMIHSDRGFSVQTNGNLPDTHRMTSEDFNPFRAANELNEYVKTYGTARQKDLLGW